MSKKIFYVESISVNLMAPADEVVELLAFTIAERKTQGWKDFELSIANDPSWGSELYLQGKRPENKVEKAERLKLEVASAKQKKLAKVQAEADELKELARLKAKYENSTLP